MVVVERKQGYPDVAAVQCKLRCYRASARTRRHVRDSMGGPYRRHPVGVDLKAALRVEGGEPELVEPRSSIDHLTKFEMPLRNMSPFMQHDV
jgi:hypothetical protein